MQLHNSLSYITQTPTTITITTYGLRIHLLAVPSSFHGNAVGGWGAVVVVVVVFGGGLRVP